MLLFKLRHLGLKRLHGPSSMKLLDGQGIHQPTDNKGQGDNGQPKAAKQDAGQPDHAVYHGVKSD